MKICQHTRRKFLRDGFSLIELLIVVTIIMILAGLLLPALRGVRERAKAIVCQSNLRDIGIGIFLYEQEYNGFPSEIVAGGQCGFFNYGSGGKTGLTISAWESQCGTDYPADLRPLNWYYKQQGGGVKELKVFRCPADVGTNQGQSYGWPAFCTSLSFYDCVGSSYMYATHTGSGYSGADIMALHEQNGKQVRRAALRAPAKKVIAYDSTWHCNVNINAAPFNSTGLKRHWFKSTASTAGNPSNLHGHVLFADGSVKYIVRIYGGGCSGTATWPNGNAGIDEAGHDYY